MSKKLPRYDRLVLVHFISIKPTLHAYIITQHRHARSESTNMAEKFPRFQLGFEFQNTAKTNNDNEAPVSKFADTFVRERRKSMLIK